MRRRLLQLLTLLSPLPFALVLLLWTRSFSYSDLVAWEPGRDVYSIWSERGEICFRQVRHTYGSLEPWRYESLPVGAWGGYMPPYARTRRAGGFWWESGLSPGRGQPYLALVVPYWAVATASLTPVAWGAHRRRRRRRRGRSGLCRECGYSLAGNVSGVCPECGTRTGPASAAPPAATEIPPGTP